jgi:hypothetical protein
MPAPGPARLIQSALAYALALAVFLEFLSGYAILYPSVFGGLIAKPLAFRLHLFIQPLMAFFFLSHFLLVLRGRIRAARSREGKRTPVLDAALAAAGIGLFCASLYFAFRG